jgi:hypothetical protein
MGTNYYLHETVCSTCGRGPEPLHIGKSSMGWVFALQIYPEEGINDLPDWVERWKRPGVEIHDEYGKLVLPDVMFNIITDRSREPWDEVRKRMPWGYSSWADFHRDNSSMEGPNGLLRCREGVRGVRHGHGTYDLHTGEFS